MNDVLRKVSDALSSADNTRHPALETFCQQTRELLEKGQDVSHLQQVRDQLRVLLANTDFIAGHCGPDAAPGLHLLYEDPDLGFQVLAHVNDKGRVSPPHDHGASWAIYGQAVGVTDMTDWERVVGESDPPLARMVATAKYRLQPGDAGLFSHGAIHSIDFEADTRFVRVTGTNLDSIQRRAFDPLTARVRMLGPASA